METLTLNDGTLLENSRAIISRDLFLYINGIDLRCAFDLLIDPEKTKKILFTQINGENVIFRGYTQMIAIRDEGNGMISAVLTK